MKFLNSGMSCLLLGAAFLCATNAKAQGISISAIPLAPKRYLSEGSVDQVIRAAVKNFDLHPEKTASLIGRSRGSAWLPKLRVGARRGLQSDVSASLAEQDDRTIRTDDNLNIEAFVSFDFSKLIFSGEESAILREERVRGIDRQELMVLVARVYYERRRLQLERDLFGKKDLATQLRIAELRALLDALSGGALSQGR